MTIGTYGVSRAAPGQRNMGGGLSDIANSQEQSATALARETANAETQRNLTNDQIERDRKSGNAQLASTVGGLAGGAAAGATYGSAAGPWGAALGAVFGAVLGGKF